MEPRRFAFRPRYRGVAWTSMGLGAVLDAAALALGLPWPALVSGVIGVALGASYLVSPAWKLEVLADDAALEVQRKGERRFRLPWTDVVKVTASRATKTCFVDGGAPDRSLLVPGDGAPAPYTIADKDALYELILERVAAVDPAKIEHVSLLEARGREGAPAR